MTASFRSTAPHAIEVYRSTPRQRIRARMFWFFVGVLCGQLGYFLAAYPWGQP